MQVFGCQTLMRNESEGALMLRGRNLSFGLEALSTDLAACGRFE